ncbi:N-acetylornithine carbamoyltransferase [Wenyingzhuangia sp. IMCC45533]
MKHYLSIHDLPSIKETAQEAIQLKKSPLELKALGKDKTIGMLFFNNSLRTRLSTQKAALNLGMNPIVMNFGSEGWQLELEDGVIMNEGKSEHIKEAAQVISQYCDVIAIRAFAGLEDKTKDEAEEILSAFTKYASVPIVNMESSVGHPLQALADAITIEEHKPIKQKLKVVLSWAPHPRALPHAVGNSFAEMALAHEDDFEVVITHPKGYELNPEKTKGAIIEYDQKKAFEGADFIYTKNWSSYNDYGKVANTDASWQITADKMAVTDNAKFMHCLPVRRNVVVADEVIDSENSIVIKQANNRTYAAQIVLKKILEGLN